MLIQAEMLEAFKKKALDYGLRLYHHNVCDLRKRLEADREVELVSAIDILLGRDYYMTMSLFLEPFLKRAEQFTSSKNEEVQESQG